jgi:hypothetical protein
MLLRAIDPARKGAAMNSPQNPPPTLTELKLPESLKQVINSAFERGKYFTVAYVGLDDRPEISFRGSVQVYSDTQLAIWARNPEGGLTAAISRNPYVSLLYGDFTPDSRAIMTFRGSARVESSESVRRKVYESSAQGEQDRDKDRRGDAVIIDLERVDGFYPGGVLKMQR